MIFITLAKWRQKPTKEMIAKSSRLFERAVKEGAKILGIYWTIGRYDSVIIMDAKDEKTFLKSIMRWGEMVSTETLVAVDRKDALKLLEWPTA